MNEIPQTEFRAGTTLADLVKHAGRPSRTDALQLVADLVVQVRSLHAQGISHRSIQAELITFDASRKPVLSRNLASTTVAQPIDTELYPPDLACGAAFSLPSSIEHARTELRRHGLQLDPRRIDIYQLTALLCRLLTGASVQTYLRSASVKGSIPVHLARLLDSGLGIDPQHCYREIEQLGEALREVLVESVASNDNRDTSTSVTPPGSTDETTVASGSLIRREQEPSLPFDTLGHYTILAKLGQGGMGDVYRARDNKLNRTVALKVLPTELARQDEFIQRFRAEATAVARLTHPNVVQIHSIDQDSGYHFFTMQFVDGPSLADLLRERTRLSVNETLEIVKQLVGGLAAAHQQGLVHRDIKPANILMDADGRALLADFGLVKSLGTASGQTASGVVLGTVDYISPEQGRGQTVDERTDLYSLGVLTYRLLSGVLPFEADSPTAMIFQHVYETPKELSKIAADVPTWLTDVVAKLMSKDPADRFSSADELLEALSTQTCVSTGSGGMHGAIISAPTESQELPTSNAATPHTWASFRDRLLDFFQRNTPRMLDRMANTQQRVDGAVALYEARCRELEALSSDAEAVVEELTRQAQLQRDAAQRSREQADQLDSAAEREAARLQEGHCRGEADKLEQLLAHQQSELQKIQLRSAKTNATLTKLRSQRDVLNARLQLAKASIQPEARSGARHRYWVAALALALAGLAGVALWRRGTPPSESSAAIAPPSSAETVSDSVQAMPNAAGLAPNEIGRFVGHSNSVLSLSITSDGSTLLSGSEDHIVILWDVASGARRGSLEGHDLGVRSIQVLPGEEQVLTAGADHALRRWDIKTGKTLMIYSGHSNEVASVAVSRDGKRFVSGSYDAGIILWAHDRPTPGWILEYKHEADIPPLRAIEDINSLEAHVTWVRSVAFAPDGQHFVSGGNEALLAIWDFDERKIVRRLIGHAQPISQVIYTDDGDRIVSASFDATIRIWDAQAGTQLALLSGHLGPVLCVALSPDERFLATGSPDLTVRIWDLETQTEVQQFEGHSDQIEAVLWSPDGKSVFSASADHSIRQWKVGQ